MADTLHFDASLRSVIEAYLPHHANLQSMKRPYVTLTYAVSLDSQIALSRSTPTTLSNSASKSMTHFLRSRHDAILVGSGTAMADDPTLNSRIDDAINLGLARQPRPVILDRRARWELSDSRKVMVAAREGKGKAPWWITSASSPSIQSIFEQESALQQVGGERISTLESASDFMSTLDILYNKGIRSVMVEGGALLINQILSENLNLVDTIILTIAPIYLGSGGVSVCPPRSRDSEAVLRCSNIQWIPLGSDVVMCGTVGTLE